jgi:hypothetical protein
MREAVFDDFRGPLIHRWHQTCIGSGSLLTGETTLRMALDTTRQGDYSDAQIDDYGRLPRSQFPWRPPLRMEVRARSGLPAASPPSGEEHPGALRGTAGFGFWNYPFSVRGDMLMLPEAVWFFYASPPSNMALVPGSPGWGWKAQVIHSLRPEAVAAALPLAITTALGRLTGDSGPAGRWMQRLTGAREALLAVDMSDWHTYVLEWQPQEAHFRVDGETVLRAEKPPMRPLGFVAWLDNQYAIATPRGVLHFGALGCGPQWIELDSVRIDAGR